MATVEDFNKIDIRVGEIIGVENFPEARKPAYKISVDFGEETGIKKSSAQLCANYSSENLLNKKILAIVNFPPRQIGPFISEILILGVPDFNGETILVQPEKDVPAGGKLY